MAVNFIRYSKDKFQRLGLLKILVAVLDPQRRSVPSELLLRRIEQVLFEEKVAGITNAERLIRGADGSSWNFRLTRPTLGHLLDWGRLYGFVGSGNQITEDGLLLRYIMGEEAVAGISDGSMLVNPFSLSLEEKLYFLYRHLEMDTSLFFLIKRLASVTDIPIGGVQGDKITCFALYDTYQLINGKRGFSAHSLLTLKGLRELIGKMVPELNLSSEIPVSSMPKLTSNLRSKSEQRSRKRTNTSDNETLPRLEFLTDIGLLEKRAEGNSEADVEKARKSWSYWPTPVLIRFSERLPSEFEPDFCQFGFARAATAFLAGVEIRQLDSQLDPAGVALRAYDAYLKVKRRFGHTSVESVAVVAMIHCLACSEILEVLDVYKFFLNIKQKGLFPDTVRFAAGNDLGNMFLGIGLSFSEEVRSYYG